MGNAAKSVVLIGSGHAATAIADALKGKRKIIQLYSKTPAHARRLAEKLHCSYTSDLKKVSREADLYILAVKDDAIEDVSKKLRLPDKFVIHTSGSTELKVLKKVSDRCGVLWPMYSFAGKSKLRPRVDFFIEASSKKEEQELTLLVNDLKGIAHKATSEKRAIIHMTAVFANNFPNHLFTIVEILCKKAGVPFKLFQPIIKETIEKISHQSPRLSQTGPASRNDKQIIDKHLALLSKDQVHPEFKDVYEALTKSIIKTSSGRARKKL